MELLRALGLENEARPIICLAGAGGKTTLLFMLCKEFRKKFKKTAAFTTTHIMRPAETDALACIMDDNVCLAESYFENGRVIIAGTPAPDEKITAPADEMMTFLLKNANAIVAEADGSRNLPLKFPNETEPCLINAESRLFVVAGLSALGQPLSEACHRWPLAMAACGISGQHSEITQSMFAQILYKGYAEYKPFFVLNQADNEQPAEAGNRIKSELSRLCGAECAVISLQEGKIW